MLSVSILNLEKDIDENIKILDNSNMDYFHLDVEDGIFVSNKKEFDTMFENRTTKKPLDVHLMVKDVYSYIDRYSKLNPHYLTFHKEVATNVEEIAEYIKSKNIKVGLSINPETKVKEIIKHLDILDLVLVMGVHPGKGGQKFIKKTFKKVKQLKKLQKKYDFKIEVDGGVNASNIKKINADISVVGSYITKSNNMIEKINELI